MFEKTQVTEIDRAILAGLNAPCLTREENATDESLEELSALLEGHEPAFTNFQAMPPSVRKTYARAYFDAKTEAGRDRRLAWITDRLHRNLRPM